RVQWARAAPAESPAQQEETPWPARQTERESGPPHQRLLTPFPSARLPSRLSNVVIVLRMPSQFPRSLHPLCVPLTTRPLILLASSLQSHPEVHAAVHTPPSHAATLRVSPVRQTRPFPVRKSDSPGVPWSADGQ